MERERKLAHPETVKLWCPATGERVFPYHEAEILLNLPLQGGWEVYDEKKHGNATDKPTDTGKI